MRIIIKHLNGRNFVIEVNGDDTVETLRTKLRAQEGDRLEQNYELISEGKPLTDNTKTLAALNIQEESCVHLKPQLAAQDAMYAVSSNIVRDRLAAEGDISALDNLSKHDVVVVAGASDHIEQVLVAIGVPHVMIQANELHKAKLNPDQTVYVNCHSSYPEGAAQNVAAFVKAGGQLITTDHVLHNLLHNAFPGYIKHDGASTPDTSVPIICNDDEKQDEVLKGFMGEKEWWLAGGSHPITVVNKDKVKILIKQVDGSPILVRFEVGEGTVYHMISHFYLQNSKTRKGAPPTASTGSYASYQQQVQQPVKSSSSVGGVLSSFKSLLNRRPTATSSSSPSSSSSSSSSPPPSSSSSSSSSSSVSLPQPTSTSSSSSSSVDKSESKDLSSANLWAQAKGATKETIAKMSSMYSEQQQNEGVSTINYDNVQSAATSSEFVMRSVLQQKKKRAQK